MDSGLKWHVYYDDGTTFGWENGAPHSAPPYGVLAITQNRDDRILVGHDYYLYRADWGLWVGVHAEGLVDQLATAVRRIDAVLIGRTVPLSVFKRVVRDLPVNVSRFYEDAD